MPKRSQKTESNITTIKPDICHEEFISQPKSSPVISSPSSRRGKVISKITAVWLVEIKSCIHIALCGTWLASILLNGIIIVICGHGTCQRTLGRSPLFGRKPLLYAEEGDASLWWHFWNSQELVGGIIGNAPGLSLEVLEDLAREKARRTSELPRSVCCHHEAKQISCGKWNKCTDLCPY